MTGYVYMTASQKRGTIYIGVTNDLGRRMPEHKSGEGSGFTATACNGWSGMIDREAELAPPLSKTKKPGARPGFSQSVAGRPQLTLTFDAA
jgi:putative endonuclease